MAAQAPAYAQGARAQGAGRQAAFDIPPGALSGALVAFGRQSGLQVTYLPQIASGKRSPGVRGPASPAAALARLLEGTGLSYSFTDAHTVQILGPGAAGGGAGGLAADGSILLDVVNVTGASAVPPAEAPFETPAPVAYISRETIERFRGSSPADMFIGTPGVLSAESRNGAGSIDVNIRGMQGLGRVNVKVDDAENQVTVYQGYQGISNRTFVDPDLIAGIDITKGADAASSGIAGTVSMRTLDASDIVEAGKTYGVRVKGTMGGNTASPEAGAKAGYGIQNVINDYPVVTSSNDGMDRPAFLEPTQGAGSVVGAVQTEHVDVLAAYAYRKQGNYFAGTHGPSARPVSTGPRPFCYPSGSCPFDYLDYVENSGLANYRAGEEVLNTELETESWLAKATLRFGDGQSLKLGYSGYRSEAGDQMASLFSSDTSRATQQAQTTGISLDTGTLQYRWQPSDNPLVNLKANLWMTELGQRNPIRVKNYFVSPSDFGLPDDFRVGSDTTMWGGDVSNVSSLDTAHGPVSLTYGMSYKNEDTRPSAYTEELEGTFLRDGERQEAAAYAKASWQPADWLTVNGGLRYQYYWSTDRSPVQDVPADDSHGQSLEDGGFSPSLGVTIEPFDGAQFYVNYSNSLRSPSIMETLTGFSTMFNPDLKPERSSNWEIGTNFVRDDVLRAGDRGMLKFGYFDWTVSDYIAREWTTLQINGYTVNTLRVYNIDKAHFSGLEFSGRYEAGGFAADLAANYYLDVEFCPTADTCGNRSLYGDYATNQVPPEYSVSLTLSQKLLDDALTLGGRISYTGPRAAGHGEATAQGLSQFIALVDWDPYMLVDVFAQYRISENLTADFRVMNLTDQFYVDPLSLVLQPGPGRTFYASLTATF